MAKNGPKELPLTERTSTGLRAVLFDELDGLRNGSINATRANAVAKLAMTIVETVRMELDVLRYTHKTKMPPANGDVSLGKPLNLVS